MNNEVNLILTKLKIVSEEKENGMYLCDKKHSKLLLDYITNLQEKNKELKKKITFNEKSRRKMQQSLMEQIEDYKSRNKKTIDKIKEYIKEDKNCIPKHINDYILELLEEVE